MSENPFATAEGWDVSTDTLFPEGNFVATITEAEDETSKGSGKPSLHLRLEDGKYSMQDWVPYSTDFLRKLVSLADAAGVARPADGEYDPQDNCRLTTGYIAKLVNKKVGIVVRDEYNDQKGQMRRRVQGYRPPEDIKQSSSSNGGGNATSDEIGF